MICLDLGAGKGGEQRREQIEAMGWEYHTLDIEPSFGCTITADVLDWWPEIQYDLIWASPPCHTYSLAGIRAHRKVVNGIPVAVSDEAKLSDKVTQRFIEICKTGRYYAIENPRATLRKQPFMQELIRHTVTYCHYGDTRMKPTDIWTNLHWTPRPMCHNQENDHPLDCCCRDHVAAVRGSTTGTQGMKAEDSAIVPFELWEEILKAVV